MLGTQAFSLWFKDWEYRKLILLDALLSLGLAPLNFIYIFRKNIQWGIPDMCMLVFESTISEIVSQCLILMPTMIILTKICPKHCEATSFALLAGVHNFSSISSSWVGSYVNETWIGVS